MLPASGSFGSVPHLLLLLQVRSKAESLGVLSSSSHQKAEGDGHGEGRKLKAPDADSMLVQVSVHGRTSPARFCHLSCLHSLLLRAPQPPAKLQLVKQPCCRLSRLK